MTVLWLFDIDGTLVNINHLHLQAHQASYKEVLNLDVPTGKILPTFGMGGYEGRKVVLKSLGFKKDDRIEEIGRSFVYHLGRIMEKSEIIPLPGVIEFLSRLNKNKENRLGVVTGNEPEMAEKTLSQSGLKPYFSFCCGDDGHTKGRTEIVRQALKEAGKVEKVVVLGDTHYDIEAGKAVGAYTVGVATGSGTFAGLSETGADLVISSMTEYGKILEMVNKIKER